MNTPAFTRRLWSERGLINTTDLLVATVATITLAAGVGTAVIGTMDDARYGKAQPDAQAISMAVVTFYKDTGKWPGQAEHAALTGPAKPPVFLVSTGVTDSDLLPISGGTGGTALSTAAAECGPTSLEGFAGSSIAAGTLTTATKFNLNDYLVRKPDESAYPNWKGPYLQAEVLGDPWKRSWIMNLQSMYCAEEIADGAGTTSTQTGGALGYAWVISGGVNATVSTHLTSPRLDPEADDAGTNIGKLLARSSS
jgi:hypothetical protein